MGIPAVSMQKSWRGGNTLPDISLDISLVVYGGPYLPYFIEVDLKLSCALEFQVNFNKIWQIRATVYVYRYIYTLF